jgi:methyl-accepting chemotaxis protein
MDGIAFSMFRSRVAAPQRWGSLRAMPRAVVQLSALALIAIISCIALTLTLALNINSNETAEKQRMLEAALAREQSALVAFVEDYSHWDDAVDNLYGQVDREWLSTNFGGEHPLYVIDGQGRTIHGWLPSGETGRDFSRDAPGLAEKLLATLPRSAAQLKATSTVSSRIIYGGKPAFIAAAPIVPFTPGRAMPTGELLYTVMIQPVDPSLLINWSQAYEVENLRLDRKAVNPARPAIAFADSGAPPLAYFSWQPGSPGLTAVRQIAPGIAVVFIVFFSIYILLVRSILQAQAALDARTAAAEAEAQKAKQAQAEIARLADQEKAMQTLHTAQLKDNARAAAELIESQIGALVADLRHQSDALEASAFETSETVRRQKGAADIAQRSSAATLAAMQEIDDNVARLVTATRAINEGAVQTEAAMRRTDEGSAAAIAANRTLVEQLQSISSAADVIRSLAAETDILALNAAIEAQHAGAMGSGFAVVASEVKELARRTKDHTGEIGTGLTSVRESAQSIAKLVSVVHQLLADLNANIGQTTSAVGQHHNHAESILAKGREVASAASSSHAAVSEIFQALGQLGGAADHTREVGAIVRDRAERLDRELAQIINKMKAA